MPSSTATQIDIAREYARKLIREHLNAGSTQTQLANKIGCDKSWVSYFLSGKRHDIRIETYFKVILELGGDVPMFLDAIGLKDDALIWRALENDPDMKQKLIRILGDVEIRKKLKEFIDGLETGHDLPL